MAGGIDDATPRTSPPAGSSPERPLRRLVVAAVAAGLLVVATVALFEGPVAKTWFHARQRQLAAEFDVPRRTPAPGGAAAILQVKRLGINVVVVEGDGSGDLRAGPGHRPESPLPGKRGNSVIVGHRSGWGGPFKDLHKLKRGDLIVTQARGSSEKVVFTVKAVTPVHDDDVHLLAPSTDYRLTLVTATGGNVSSDHLMVVAISGERGKLARAHVHRTEIAKVSSVFNLTFMFALLALALAAVAFVQLRRRHSLGATLVVVIPLALAGIFAMLLTADLLLSPLR